MAVIDSGSGGINVLSELFKSCHGCDFLYLADEKNAPYGEKDPDELKQIAVSLVNFLKGFFNPEIVVFACNTLTAVAINYVRKAFPEIIFIGCEPAIKPACQKYGEENVLVLATPVTISHSALIKKYPNLLTLSIDNLPTLIDQNLLSLDALQPLLQRSIAPYSPKAIVLGCTHFEALKDVLTFSGAQLFSSSEGIAKRLNTFCGEGKENAVSFMTTSGGAPNPLFSEYFFQKISTFD